MSLTSRSRHIQALSGLSLQKCNGLLRQLEAKPAHICREKGWNLKQSDAYLLGFAGEDGATLPVVPTQQARCSDCKTAFFTGDGEPRCPWCRGDHQPAAT